MSLSFRTAFLPFLLLALPAVAQADGASKKQLRTEKRAIAWFARDTGCDVASITASLLEEEGIWRSYELAGCEEDLRVSFYGGSTPSLDDKSLPPIAAFDMKCEELEITFLSRTQRGVTGCGVSGRYLLHADGWVLNAREGE